MSLPDCRLYLITPPTLPDLAAFTAALGEALAGGDVAALQVRLKDVPDDEIARAVAAVTPVCQAHDVAVMLIAEGERRSLRPAANWGRPLPGWWQKDACGSRPTSGSRI